MPEPMVYCLHHYGSNHDKFYAVQVNAITVHNPATFTTKTQYEVRAYWGKANADKAQASKVYGVFNTFFQAHAKAESMVEEKIEGGYLNLMDYRYTGGYSPQDIYAKIDMTRVLDDHGRPLTPTQAPAPKPTPVTPKAKPRKAAATARPETINRSRRLIDI